MKKIAAILLATLFAALAFPMAAAGAAMELDAEKNYVMDAAGVLTDAQRIMLEVRAAELSNKYRCDVRIVTVANMAHYGYHTIEYFAYDIYREFDFGYGEDKDCVLLTLSADDRDYDFRVWGDYAKTAFTLYGIDSILDKYILKELAEDNYYAAFIKYLDRAEVYFKMAERGKPFDFMTDPGVKLGILFLVALVASLIALVLCTRWKNQMKTAKIARTAGHYIPEGGFRLTGQGDVFMYRTVSRTYIERDSDSSSGGGASSGGSGGSSGRSGKY